MRNLLRRLTNLLKPAAPRGRQAPRPAGFRPRLEALEGRLTPSAIKTTGDVLSFADLSVKGTSTLIRTDNGVSMQLKTTDLEPGAYTVWWVAFNNPENCTGGVCGDDEADFDPELTGFSFGYAAGGIVGPSGKATFAGHVNEGEILSELGSLADAMTSEVHLVLRYHGAKDPGNIYEQTHTMQPELGLEADIQFAMHPAPSAKTPS
jgi:hypothetical protein